VLNDKSSPPDPAYGRIGVRIIGYGVFSVTGQEIPYWLVLTAFAPDDLVFIESGSDSFGIESNSVYADIRVDQYRCGAGESFDVKSMRCQPCAAGSFSPRAGLLPCVACNSGTYSNGTGSTQCTSCAQCPNNGTIVSGQLIVDETCSQGADPNNTLCACPPFSSQPLTVERDRIARTCQAPRIKQYASPSLSTSFFVHGAPLLLLVMSMAPLIACCLLRPATRAARSWLIAHANVLKLSSADRKNAYSGSIPFNVVAYHANHSCRSYTYIFIGCIITLAIPFSIVFYLFYFPGQQ
jgi:hypothetical protein